MKLQVFLLCFPEPNKQRVSPSCAVIGATKPEALSGLAGYKSLAADTETGEVAISSAEQLGETNREREDLCAVVPKRHTNFLIFTTSDSLYEEKSAGLLSDLPRSREIRSDSGQGASLLNTAPELPSNRL